MLRKIVVCLLLSQMLVALADERDPVTQGFKTCSKGFKNKKCKPTGQKSKCCNDKCPSISCRDLGFGVSATVTCQCVKKKNGTYQRSKQCPNIKCSWDPECDLEDDRDACLGEVVCDDDHPDCKSSFLGLPCLQAEKAKRKPKRFVKFRICDEFTCTKDEDCQGTQVCKLNEEGTGKECQDDFTPSGGDDCECDDQYRSEACLDLENGGVEGPDTSTAGYLSVTVPGCTGLFPQPSAAVQQVLTDYGCTQSSSCDQDWVCERFVPADKVDIITQDCSEEFID